MKIIVISRSHADEVVIPSPANIPTILMYLLDMPLRERVSCISLPVHLSMLHHPNPHTILPSSNQLAFHSGKPLYHGPFTNRKGRGNSSTPQANQFMHHLLQAKAPGSGSRLADNIGLLLLLPLRCKSVRGNRKIATALLLFSLISSLCFGGKN